MLAWSHSVCDAVSLQASGPQATVPAPGAWLWWMVWCSKLPLWPLQQQYQAQHPRLQQFRDGWQVVSHSRTQIYTTAEPIKIVCPSWLRGIVWLAAPRDELSVSLPLPSLYQLCLCIPFSAHLFSPKQPYVYSGSLELAVGRVFRLAVGLISAAYLGPGQARTHTWTRLHTDAHTRPPETAGCVGCMRRHLEEVKRERERDACHRFSARRATLQQCLITVPSAQLRLPNMSSTEISHQHGPQEANLLPPPW